MSSFRSILLFVPLTLPLCIFFCCVWCFCCWFSDARQLLAMPAALLWRGLICLLWMLVLFSLVCLWCWRGGTFVLAHANILFSGVAPCPSLELVAGWDTPLDWPGPEHTLAVGIGCSRPWPCCTHCRGYSCLTLLPWNSWCPLILNRVSAFSFFSASGLSTCLQRCLIP